MDDDGLRNWGYYEPALSRNLNLQLMSNVAERGTKSFLPGRDPNNNVMLNGGYHNHHHFPRTNYGVSEPPSHAYFPQLNYSRDGWGNHTDKFINVLPSNPHYHPVLLPESSQAHTLHMIQPLPSLVKDERVDVTGEEIVERDDGDNLFKKRKCEAPKTPKTKKPRIGPKENGGTSVRRVKTPKNSLDVVINGMDMDISGIPIPVCSCTSTPQQCYRWGCGGWQSACCTTSISMHPLPMSTKRRGARIAGRKMSQGAFKKVLEKLASEDYNFANPIDLRTHWAKHGTNKFVTIR